MTTTMTVPTSSPPTLAPQALAPSVVAVALRDFAPFALALVPFSLAIGNAAALNGLSLAQAAFGAVILLAGTAQLAATELIGSNASAATVVATVVIINARFVIYGAGLARWFSTAPLRHRLVLAFPLVDQSFLCCEQRFTTMTDPGQRRRYYLAGTTMLLLVFLGSELVGYLAGSVVPGWLGLHLAAPLAFAGMLMKAIRTSTHATAALAAAATVVVAAALPGGLGLPLAILVGVCAGTRAERGRS